MTQHTDIRYPLTADQGAPHIADGDEAHECEFCSPEPEIMPPPRSGAIRSAERQSGRSTQEALGEPRT